VKAAISIIIIAAIIGGVWYFNQGGPPSGRPPSFGPVLVVTEPVQQQPFINSIEALGTTRANESLTLTANLTDTIRRVNFEDGDYVEAGQVLVELTNEEEGAQLAEARANLDEAQRQLRRLEDLDKQGIAATSDVDQARSAAAAAEARLNTVLARLEDRLIRAPFSGVLGFRQVSPGTLLTPGEAITTLDDVSQIKLDFTVPETILALMRKDRKIVAKSVSWQNREFEGVVRAVDSRVDPVTRAAVVRAIIDNEDGALRPGMLLSVKVVTEERTAILVPEKSVVQVSDSAFVYIVDDEQKASRTPVQLGSRQPGIVEITQGLAEGDRIVTEGIVKLRDGMQVRTADQSLAQRDGRPGATGQGEANGPPGRPGAASQESKR
jgi:membrane fusion protein (multidrug efflux system)